MSAPAPELDHRIFVKDGRRVFRKKFSMGEVWAGAAVLAALVALTAWVAWKGAHPEPGLFDASVSLARLDPGGAGAVGGRGPLPAGIAPAGWSEGPPSSFDGEDLYVKINGRADYYKSFGFQRLHFMTLTHEKDPTRTVDLELFDQGAPANALGAYEGERTPGASPELDDSGLSHIDRNALFLTRGRYYLRAIGASEDEVTREALRHVLSRVRAAMPAEPLPFSYALFAGRLGIPPGSIAFEPENAFSFGFAKDVHVGKMPDGTTELFVVAAPAVGAAEALAAQFLAGFLEYGEPAGEDGGTAWAKDRYLSTFATARAEPGWVVGVRGASDRASGAAALTKLAEAVRTLPAPSTAGPAPPAAEPRPEEAHGESPAAPAAPEAPRGHGEEEISTATPYN